MSDRSTPKSVEKLEPKEQRLRKIKKDGGGSRGSSRSSSCSASRESTPIPIPKRPKNQYTREKLMQLRLSPLCKKKPSCMVELLDCDLPDVIRDEPIGLEDIGTSKCESDVWYKHTQRHLQEHDSRGNSPLTVSGGDRKRFSEAGDVDTAYKKRGADLRGKEEEDETGGIVLGPQRKSFGTGCHVTTTAFSRKNDSPKEHDRDSLRPRVRIGSGRITVDHERERAGDRSYRDRDLRDGRDPPPRRFERADSGRGNFGSERNNGGGGYEKDRYQRNRDYDNRDDGRDDRRDRDYGDRRYDNNRRYGRSDHSHHAAAEPEWFTSGPSSQADTIELVGFDMPTREDRSSSPQEEASRDERGRGKRGQSGHGQSSHGARRQTQSQQQQHQGGGGGRGGYTDDHNMADNSQMEESMQEQHKDTCVSVADRNGSLETNESSSPEHSQNSDDDHGGVSGAVNQRRHLLREAGNKDPSAAGGAGENFDLNDIFIKNIPGLSDLIGSIDREVPTPTEPAGSRFSQWFQPGAHGPGSHENSRRSSINEDFSYLHDMLNGSKSPVIPSPPLTSQHMAMFHHPGVPVSTSHHQHMEAAKHHNLIELLGSKGMLPPHQQQQLQQQQQQINVYHAQHSRTVTSVTTQQGAVSVSDVEASLKALLLPGGNPNKVHPEQHTIKNIPNLVPPGGKVLTAEELEASLTGLTTVVPPPKREQPGDSSSVAPPSGGGGGFTDLPRKIRGQGMAEDPTSAGFMSSGLGIQSNTNANINHRTGLHGNQSETQDSSFTPSSFYHQQNVFSETSSETSVPKSSSIFPTSVASSRFPPSQASYNPPTGGLRKGDQDMHYIGASGVADLPPIDIRASGQNEHLTMPTSTQGRPIYSSSVGASHPMQTMSAGLQSSSTSSNNNDGSSSINSNNTTSNSDHPQVQQQIFSLDNSGRGAVLDGGLNPDFLPRRPSIEKHPCLPRSPAVIQGGAKVTTLAELEEELHPRQLGQGQEGRKVMVTGQPGGGRGGGGVNTPDAAGMLASQQQQQQDMAAFNRLLGMVKVAGESNDPAAMAMQQQALNLQHIQKEPITRRDMIQKIVQQQQQQQQAKAQQATAAVKQLQQQQAKQMQQQQQLQVLKHLMGKHAAAVVSGKSPIPPQQSLQPLQPSVSPRCPSPLLQPPVSPRAPSPIMFGSQPPMHLTAPSPIHASPVAPSGGGGSSNTLQVSQANAANPALARVPSPQELIVHTQAIMQNALIKRQLEEQKERFLKRQQAKSPNTASNVSTATISSASTSISGAQTQALPTQTPTATSAQAHPPVAMEEGGAKPAVNATPQGDTSGQAGNTSVTSNMTSTPASTKAAVNPAFTPTSVIRKMVSEKADEKEKEIKQLHDSSRQDKSTPVLRIVPQDEGSTADVSKTENGGQVSIQVPEVNSQQTNSRPPRQPVIQGLINIPQQQQQHLQQQLFQPQPSVGPGHGTPAVHPAGMFAHGGLPAGNPGIQPGPGPAQLPQQPIIGGTGGPTMVTGSIPASQAGRPIVKGTSPGSNPLSPQQYNNPASSGAAPNPTQRPIVGGNAHQQPPQQQMMQGMNQSPQITMEAMRLLEQQQQQRQIQAQLAAAVPRGRPITGRRTSSGNTPTTTPQQAGVAVSSHLPPQAPPPNPAINPLVASQAMLMQKMMHPGASPAAVQQIQQFAALQAQMLQQQQQQQNQQQNPHHQQPRPGMVDPRMANTQGPPPVQGGRPIFGASGPTGPNPLNMPHTASSGMGGLRSVQELQALSSTAGGRPLLTSSGGPVSGQDASNLARFFGNDLLKQQVNAMPPLPNQSSQRVLTLEEIERRQQMVTN